MSVARALTDRHRALLDERSAALARRGTARWRDGEHQAGTRQAFLVCACGTEHVGLPLPALAGILPDRPCTLVPGSPAGLRGIIAHAGTIVSVIDLGMAIGAVRGGEAGDHPREPDRREGHLVRLRSQDPPVALAVDRAVGFARVPADAIAAAPGSGTRLHLGNEAVSGYCAADADDGSGVKTAFTVVDLQHLLRPFLP